MPQLPAVFLSAGSGGRNCLIKRHNGFFCMKKYLSALAFGSLVSTSAMAEFSPDFQQCMDMSSGVTGAVIACCDAESARQEARINDALNAVMSSSISVESKAKLKAHHDAWMKYRDSARDFYRTMENNVYLVVASQAETEMLNAQAEYLESILKYEEL